MQLNNVIFQSATIRRICALLMAYSTYDIQTDKIFSYFTRFIDRNQRTVIMIRFFFSFPRHLSDDLHHYDKQKQLYSVFTRQ